MNSRSVEMAKIKAVGMFLFVGCMVSVITIYYVTKSRWPGSASEVS